MTKKQLSIGTAAAVAVAAVVAIPQKEPPYVWGGFAEERQEIKCQVQFGKQSYEVRRICGASNAIVSVWQNGKQVGRDFVSGSTNGVDLVKQARKQ